MPPYVVFERVVVFEIPQPRKKVNEPELGSTVQHGLIHLPGQVQKLRIPILESCALDKKSDEK